MVVSCTDILDAINQSANSQSITPSQTLLVALNVSLPLFFLMTDCSAVHTCSDSNADDRRHDEEQEKEIAFIIKSPSLNRMSMFDREDSYPII